jgi:hypothetical protein
MKTTWKRKFRAPLEKLASVAAVIWGNYGNLNLRGKANKNRTWLP